jgi:hypothetical protein
MKVIRLRKEAHNVPENPTEKALAPTSSINENSNISGLSEVAEVGLATEPDPEEKGEFFPPYQLGVMLTFFTVSQVTNISYN